MDTIAGVRDSDATLQMLRETIPGMGGVISGSPLVRKADSNTAGITMESLLFGYPLFRPALQLYAVFTMFVEMFGRHTATGADAGGDAAHWRQVDRIMGAGWDGSAAEAGVGTLGQNDTTRNEAYFKTLASLGEVTFESVSAGQGYDDVKAMETLHTLQRLRHYEEVMDIGGCTTGVIKPASVSIATDDAAGSMTPSGHLYVGITAFTLHGSAALPGNTQVKGKATTGATDAPFETDARTADEALGASDTEAIITWPAVPGAVGYNVYVSLISGIQANLHYRATVNANTYTVLTDPSGTGNVANTLNQTARALQYDGFLVQASQWNNPAGITLPDGSAFSNFYDMGGKPFTASGYGSIDEIDTMLQREFQALLVGFDLLVVSPREKINLRNKILTATAGGSNTGAPGAFRLILNDKADSLTGGSVFANYLNPLTDQVITVKTHPFLPPGTAVGMCTRLPAYYPNANLPGGTTWGKELRRDYYGVDYAVALASGRTYPFGNYLEGVLAGFFPGGTVVFSGVGNG